MKEQLRTIIEKYSHYVPRMTKKRWLITALFISTNVAAGYAGYRLRGDEPELFPLEKVCLTEEQAFEVILRNGEQDPTEDFLRIGSGVILEARSAQFVDLANKRKDALLQRGGRVYVRQVNGRLRTGVIENCAVILPHPYQSP